MWCASERTHARDGATMMSSDDFERHMRRICRLNVPQTDIVEGTAARCVLVCENANLTDRQAYAPYDVSIVRQYSDGADRATATWHPQRTCEGWDRAIL